MAAYCASFLIGIAVYVRLYQLRVNFGDCLEYTQVPKGGRMFCVVLGFSGSFSRVCMYCFVLNEDHLRSNVRA